MDKAEMEDAFERSSERQRKLYEMFTGKEDNRTIEERKLAFFRYREKIAEMLKDTVDD